MLVRERQPFLQWYFKLGCEFILVSVLCTSVSNVKGPGLITRFSLYWIPNPYILAAYNIQGQLKLLSLPVLSSIGPILVYVQPKQAHKPAHSKTYKWDRNHRIFNLTGSHLLYRPPRGEAFLQSSHWAYIFFCMSTRYWGWYHVCTTQLVSSPLSFQLLHLATKFMEATVC